MKAQFIEIKANPIQNSQISQFIGKNTYFTWQQTFPIATKIASMVTNNIDNVFNICENSYFFINVDCDFYVMGGAKTKQLFFRADKLELKNDNSIKVISVKFIPNNLYQIKQSLKNS